MRYRHEQLQVFARSLLESCGLRGDYAYTTARLLVDADLLGYTSHGLNLLTIYCARLESGEMASDGEVELVSRPGPSLLLDGHMLPGQVVTSKAVEAACAAADTYGVATAVARRSQHTGCHAAYLEQATDHGYLVFITAANAKGSHIAPFGSTNAMFAPSALAVGIPAADHSILADLTLASVANGVARQKHRAGERLEGLWLLDHEGVPTDDPAVLFEEPRGSILPLGGHDNGHKGFALILLTQALTLGLGGVDPEELGSVDAFGVIVQVYDPNHFGGRPGFERYVNWLTEQVRGSVGVDGKSPRLPGDRSRRARREQLELGISLEPALAESLAELGARYGISFPSPIGGL